MNKRLYIGSLSFDTTEDELRELFSRVGTVRSAEVIRDRYTGRSRGFGFVEMETVAEAEVNSRVLLPRKHVKSTAGCDVPAMWVWICVDHKLP